MDSAPQFVLAEGRGLLPITHRLFYMQRMDRILILEGGRTLERGTHGNLVVRGGAYRRMVGVRDRTLAPR